MNFKPALCPSCGGKMQIPDDLKTIKCMYCGIDVIVEDAVRLSGRVKEFTQATAVEKLSDEWKPFDIERARKNLFIMLSILGGFGLLIALCLGGEFGIWMGVTFLVFLPIIYVINNVNLKKTEKADKEMSMKPRHTILVGYKGQCPYCNSSINLKADVLGDNCPACHKRIVIRDSKFYSIDTPISGLKT